MEMLAELIAAVGFDGTWTEIGVKVSALVIAILGSLKLTRFVKVATLIKQIFSLYDLDARQHADGKISDLEDQNLGNAVRPILEEIKEVLNGQFSFWRSK